MGSVYYWDKLSLGGAFGIKMRDFAFLRINKFSLDHEAKQKSFIKKANKFLAA